jgi:hypothetical protein
VEALDKRINGQQDSITQINRLSDVLTTKANSLDAFTRDMRM